MTDLRVSSDGVWPVTIYLPLPPTSVDDEGRLKMWGVAGLIQWHWYELVQCVH